MATKKSPTSAKNKRTATANKTTRKATVKTKKPIKKAAEAKRAVKTTKKAVSRSSTKASTTKTRFRAKSGPLQSLLKVRVFGALLCAVAAGLVVAYGNDIAVGITSQYVTANALTSADDLLPATTELFQVNLKFVIAGILAAAALHRVLLMTWLAKTYESQVDKKLTSSNWVELGVVGPWALATIAAIVGVRDAMTLLLIAGVVSGTALLGYLTDRYNFVGKKTLQKNIIITKALLLPWVVIGVVTLHAYIYGFVTFDAEKYALLAVAFAAYLLIAFMHKQQISAVGRFSHFITAEKYVAFTHLLLLVVLAAAAFV